MPVIRGIFFDAAGTLIELAEPVGVTYARFGGAHGVRVSPAVIEQAFFRAWRETPAPERAEGSPAPEDDDRSWWEAVARRAFGEAVPSGIPEPVFDRLFDALYRHFAQPSAWRLFDDVIPALDILRPHYGLHLLSNFDLRLHSILRGLGIADYFQTWTLSSRVGAGKPHPRIFRHALANAGLAAENALHIGDEPEADLRGAAAAGLHAWLVNRRAGGKDLAGLAEKLVFGDYSCLQPPGS